MFDYLRTLKCHVFTAILGKRGSAGSHKVNKLVPLKFRPSEKCILEIEQTYKQLEIDGKPVRLALTSELEK